MEYARAGAHRLLIPVDAQSAMKNAKCRTASENQETNKSRQAKSIITATAAASPVKNA